MAVTAFLSMWISNTGSGFRRSKFSRINYFFELWKTLKSNNGYDAPNRGRNGEDYCWR